MPEAVGMRIDAHTHCYPEEIFADGVSPVAWARGRGETHWAHLVSPSAGGASLQGFVSRGQMCADMDAAGVSHALLAGWYWEKAETCRWHNAFMARWIREEPRRFSALAALQVRGNSEIGDDLRRAKDAGFKGVGEIFPQAQGFSMRDAAWLRALEWAQENGFIVQLHAEEAAGRPHPGRAHPRLDDYVWIARRFPNVKFIFAHWGGGLPFYEMNPYVSEALRHVFYDTAASPFLYDDGVFARVCDAIGAERVLFGSDYPLRLYPKKGSRPEMSPFLERAMAATPATARAAVVGGNARALLGL